MSHSLDKEVAIELGRIRHMIDVHESLLNKCATDPPDAIELSALATVLHSFYTGTENLFKRILRANHEGVPEGNAWHRQLLERIATASPGREKVISSSLLDDLSEYLAFRHFFRHSYSFDLSWDKMARLVLNIRPTFARLEQEIKEFMDHDKLNSAIEPS